MTLMSNNYNAALTKVLEYMPSGMRSLPITEQGWPQLWFAGITEDGKPDLRCADPAKRVRAVKQNLCWLCGQPLGVRKTFVIGPMCAVTRTTAEPPCHLDCAAFSAIACPFLSRPKARRNDVDLPAGHKPPDGIAIMRNPGVTCLWVCRDYECFRTGEDGGWLIRIGSPDNVFWFAEGLPANAAQITASIDSGYPLLLAEAEKDGADAIAALGKQRAAVERYLPQ